MRALSRRCASTAAWLALVTAGSTLGCVSHGQPEWIDRPASYYSEPRPDLVLAVGKSDTATGSMRHRQAETDAFVKLLEQSKPAQADPSDAAEQVIEGELGPSRILATWTSPEGWVYALALMELY